MTEKLKPCPHCGSVKGLYPSYNWHREDDQIVMDDKPHAIDCICCGYDFTPREGMDVIAMWNKRHDRRKKSNEAAA